MYDVTSTNGHSEDYYQVPLKKNLKLESEEKTTQRSTHERNEENTTKRKKLVRKERRRSREGEKVSEKSKAGY